MLSLVTNNQFFDIGSCQSIIQVANDLGFHAATTYGGDDEYVRNCQVTFISIDQAPVLTDMCTHYMRLHGFNLGIETGELEVIQIAKYEPGCHYDWHHDIDYRDLESHRKISLSMPLNDDFSGGQLQFRESSSFNPPGLVGEATIFPSYLTHRVLPVKSGVKYSMVAWMKGLGWR